MCTVVRSDLAPFLCCGNVLNPRPTSCPRRQLSDRNHALAMRDLVLSNTPGLAPVRSSIRCSPPQPPLLLPTSAPLRPVSLETHSEPCCRTVEGRKRTYVNWPHKTFQTLTPATLSQVPPPSPAAIHSPTLNPAALTHNHPPQAGFFYTPSPEFEDRVTCAYCSLELGSWEDGDMPMVSHK